ncbi:phosphatase PAP2 family protein, partial [Clostridium perfringens]
LAQAQIAILPLKDYSFPSGHTTAAFSVAIPFLFVAPGLAQILLPLASIGGLSRIYRGVHYPSDCRAGCFLGSGTARLGVRGAA